MRKFLAALLAAALLFPVIVAPAAGVPLDKAVASVEAPALGEGQCETSTGVINEHVGDVIDPTTFTNIRGIRSQIFDVQDLDYCSSGADLTHGPSYWVALQPGPGNPERGSDTAILQIGVINCESPGLEECTGSPQYFWADGGCNGDHPQAQGLGAAPIGGITFAVRHIGNGTYWLTADPVASGPTISVYTNTVERTQHIDCWALGGGDTKRVAGSIACERWDRGDNCGGNSDTAEIDFTTIRYQLSVDGQWYIPGTGNPHGIGVFCSTTVAEMHCSGTQGQDRMETYVVQQ